MSAHPLAVMSSGLVTSVGLSAPAACAAIRSGLTNPIETRFADSEAEWIIGHAVPLDPPLRGIDRLARMASMAAEECLIGVPRTDWPDLPVMLCVAEPDRPGRLDEVPHELFERIGQSLETQFASSSRIVEQGRVSVAVALLHARKLIYELNVPQVLIVAVDSLLTASTLRALDDASRLLTPANSNGFIPGEASSAILVSKPGGGAALTITGLGFAVEQATLESEAPLRAEGLSQAINDAVLDAGCAVHDMDFRIADISGEQYYFKEAALARSRTLHRLKEEHDLWHPADCIGETGSAIGPLMIAVAAAAARKGYAPGPAALLHLSNDAGQRAAIVTRTG